MYVEEAEECKACQESGVMQEKTNVTKSDVMKLGTEQSEQGKCGTTKTKKNDSFEESVRRARQKAAKKKALQKRMLEKQQKKRRYEKQLLEEIRKQEMLKKMLYRQEFFRQAKIEKEERSEGHNEYWDKRRSVTLLYEANFMIKE